MKTRPILLGIITLIIGFILGMLTSAQLRLHKLKPVRVYFSEERFREGFYKTIQPDEEQKAKIDLMKYVLNKLILNGAIHFTGKKFIVAKSTKFNIWFFRPKSNKDGWRKV